MAAHVSLIFYIVRTLCNNSTPLQVSSKLVGL